MINLIQVSLLSRIHHRNLVTFLGYSQEDGRNILVYEFMRNGTLKDHLHGKHYVVLIRYGCHIKVPPVDFLSMMNSGVCKCLQDQHP